MEGLDLSGEGCLVLCYHRIPPGNPLIKSLYVLTNIYSEDEEFTLYSVYANTFRKQLNYLKEHGAYFITALELDSFINNGVALPPKSVLVTFDDTDVSIYNNAFPILEKENIPFTLFVISGHIGDQDFKGLELCTVAQIKEMSDSGLATVGSHTHEFHYLNQDGNPPFMNPKRNADFEKDIKLSFQTLIESFGIKEKYFSYPYGFGTPETDYLLLDSDVNLIFTLKSGIVKAGDPSFFIKRVLVNEGTWDSIANWVKNN